jgi:hypothetical protein
MLTHARLADALMRLGPGDTLVLGVPVRRLPPDSKHEPAGGRYRVAGGEIQMLLAAMDAVIREAGLKPLAGEAPWRDADEAGPVPSYGRAPATGYDNDGP